MATLAAPPNTAFDWRGLLQRHGFLLAAIAAVAVPTLIKTAEQAWTLEAGVHGPLVLATAVWLIWRRWPDLNREAVPGSLAVTGVLVGLAAALYAVGRAYGFLSIEVGALLLGLLAVAYAYFGRRALARAWFPVLYMLFVIPLPGYIVDSLTGPLKMVVSQVVTWLMTTVGYPVVRVGVTLYIDQFQLLVEDACAGLNSIISLTAMGLFYIYLLYDASWRYALLLTSLLIPIAVAANIIRVVVLVLITYYFGDEAAQGYLHSTAGLVTFVSALLLTFAIDTALSPVRRWLTPAGHRPA